jgi:hypothetical protein
MLEHRIELYLAHVLRDGIFPNRGMIVMHPNNALVAHATPVGLSCSHGMQANVQRNRMPQASAPSSHSALSNGYAIKGQAVTIAGMSNHQGGDRQLELLE